MDNKLKDNTFNFKVDNIMNDAFDELQATLGFSNKTKVFEFMIVKTLESMTIRNNPYEDLYHVLTRGLKKQIKQKQKILFDEE